MDEIPNHASKPGSPRTDNQSGWRGMMRTLLSIVVGAAVFASCTFRETHARCQNSADCNLGEECYLEFCVVAEATSEPDTRTDAAEPIGQAMSEPTPEVTTGCELQSTQASEPEGACCVAPASCYDGPDGTLGVGACRSGVRACVDGWLSACSESVTPGKESCQNQGVDDDCNGAADDIAGRGDSCTLSSGFGPCGEGRLDCVEGMESLSCVREGPEVPEACNDQDDDCDGQIDEGFDISSDRANCGMCGQTCASAELCCAGVCLAMHEASESGCPACGTQNPCADAAMCCGGACRDMTRDRRHCGACGHSCEHGQRCCEGTCKTSCD